jgi:hypothetical protein
MLAGQGSLAWHVWSAMLLVTDVCPAPSTLCLQLTTTSTMEVIDLIGQEYMT